MVTNGGEVDCFERRGFVVEFGGDGVIVDANRKRRGVLMVEGEEDRSLCGCEGSKKRNSDSSFPFSFYFSF